MRRIIGCFALFAAGVGVGIFLMQPSQAQTRQVSGLRLSHVGIYVKDFEESMRYYTQIIGLPEAFTMKDADGKPILAYLQLTRDTFLELQPAAADRPLGMSHIGIWPEDLNATVAALRQRGLQVNDPTIRLNQVNVTNILDPNGVRVELLDFLPGSLARNAMENWKK